MSSKPIFNAGTERFIRDWRSAIVTVTVRDQRMREHDPILGVVPLKLSDILQTSSQVTRWYPLDGGIGFGRIRISLLFRSVETRLPPQQLGWDVGTFEFTSGKILATGYTRHAKLKMRTGGSTGKIARTQCTKTEEGDGMYWDLAKNNGENNIRLPVRYRYRAPIIFELHTASHRSADAYAVIWLHHFEDNKIENVNIPIWKTDNGMRLTQNYITEQNYKDIPDIKIEEIGRLQFQGRFKAGTDEDHSRFVTDNDSRETQETWEACRSEGVRDTVVTKELPPAVQKLHDQSLTQGRDVLSQASEGEKQKWLSKDGTDWSGAFGKDPAAYADRKGAQTAGNGNSQNQGSTSNGDNGAEEDDDNDEDDSSSDSDSKSDGSDLGLHDATNHDQYEDDQVNGEGEKVNGPNGKSRNPAKQMKNYGESKKDLHRQQRGLMQWKPMRSMRFAKNEAKFAVKKTLKVGSLSGRQPDIETEA